MLETIAKSIKASAEADLASMEPVQASMDPLVDMTNTTNEPMEPEEDPTQIDKEPSKSRKDPTGGMEAHVERAEVLKRHIQGVTGGHRFRDKFLLSEALHAGAPTQGYPEGNKQLAQMGEKALELLVCQAGCIRGELTREWSLWRC